jgi:transcriptional regulator with XRE-family HTH domain
LATFCGVPVKSERYYDSIMKTQTDKRPTRPRWAAIAVGLMKQKKITQEDLKSDFGVTTRGAVGHYMTGRREPTIDQLLKVAKRLGVNVSQLIGEIPLAPSVVSSLEVSRLLAQVDKGDLPLLMSLLQAAASSPKNGR